MSNDNQTLPAWPDGYKLGKWHEIRQDGKLLFEYDPEGGQVRLRRWGREFVIDLGAIEKRPQGK